MAYLIEIDGESESVYKHLRALAKRPDIEVKIHLVEPVIELDFIESILHPKKNDL